MKPNRFLWLTFFAIAAFAATYTLSCKQDTEQLQQQPTNDVPVTERATCTTPDYCNLQVTVLDDDAELILCGDLPDIPGDLDPCDTGCNPTSDQELDGTFPEDVTREHCIAEEGSVCITNVGTNTATIQVQIGNSTPIEVELDPSEKHCFHTNGTCTLTADDCF